MIHEFSTAATKSLALTVLHSVGLLALLQEYACGALPSRALSGRRFLRFVTRTYGSSGPNPDDP